jgi:hypothetical protein
VSKSVNRMSKRVSKEINVVSKQVKLRSPVNHDLGSEQEFISSESERDGRDSASSLFEY